MIQRTRFTYACCQNGSFERLVDEARDGVGERVGVKLAVAQRVPPPATPDAQLDVVVGPPGVGQDAAHLMAEVALDLQDESGDAPSRVPGLPAQELARERPHAGRRLARADRAADEDAGVQAQLGDDEPPPIGHFALRYRMVHLADHQGGRRVVCAGRPRREHAGDRAAAGAREPHAACGHADRHEPDDGDGGRQIVPGPDPRVEARRVDRDQVGDRVGAGRRERPPDPHRGGGGPAGEQPDHGAPSSSATSARS